MPVFRNLRGTRENLFSVGDGSYGAKYIVFQTDDVVRPTFGWNPAARRIETTDTSSVAYALMRVREEVRLVPTVVGDYVCVGTFTASAGAYSFHITLTGSDGADGVVVREYLLPVTTYPLEYTTVAPTLDTGAIPGQDFALELGVSSGSATLRLRRTKGSSLLEVLARILILGSDKTSYEPLVSTGTSTAIGIYSARVAEGLIPLSMPAMSDGDFGYITGVNTLDKTDALGEVSSVFVAAHVGFDGLARVTGVVPNAKFSLASATPACGDRVFLACANDEGGGAAAGKVTVNAPTTGFVAEVGVVSSVDLGSYPTQHRASVVLHPKGIMYRS